MPNVKINELQMHGKTDGVISNIVINDATFKDVPYKRQFTLNNFFYGPNGTGKSTIAEAIQGSVPSGYKSYYFNQDYVNGMMTRVKDPDQSKKGLPPIFVLGKANKEVQAEVKELLVESKNQEMLKDKYKAQKEEKDKELSTEIKKLSKQLLDKETNVKNRFISTYFSYDEKRTIDSTSSVIEAFSWDMQPVTFEMLEKHEQKEKDAVVEYPTYTLLNADNFFEEANKLLFEPLVNENQSWFSGFLKRINATDWFFEAHKVYHGKTEGKCPYCGQDLPVNFDKIVEDAFDNTYKEIKDRIVKMETYYRSLKDRMDIAIDDIYEVRKKSPVGAKLVQMTTLELTAEKLKHRFEDIVNIIDKKLENPSLSLSIENYNDDINIINDILKQENLRISEFNKKVKDATWLKSEGRRLVCSYFWTKYSKEITAIKEKKQKRKIILDEFDSMMLLAQNASLEAKSKAETKKQSSSNTFDTVENINGILNKSGFTGFHIEEVDKVTHAIQVIRDSTGKPASKLSEGEKNFIMFLYFYFSVIGAEPDGTISNKIVIIDDPVTSMDSQALFIISSLTKELISISSNRYDRSVGPDNSEYIHQFFLFTHNPVFFRNVTESWIEPFEHNTFFTVRKINNESSLDYSTKPNEHDRSRFVNKIPTRSTYINLWSQYNEATDVQTLMGICRQILNEYFFNTCCYTQDLLETRVIKDNENKLVIMTNGKEDTSNLIIVRSLIAFLKTKMTDDYFIDTSALSVDALKNGLKLVFDCAGHLQHYQEMIKIS